MSKFEEIGCAKIAFDRADDSAQLNVNLADVGRNEIRAMRQAMNGPNCSPSGPMTRTSRILISRFTRNLGTIGHLVCEWVAVPRNV